jgi:hypothetical protein
MFFLYWVNAFDCLAYDQFVYTNKVFFFHFILRKNKDIDVLTFLLHSGADIFQSGWMKIEEEFFFGSSLVLALWMRKKLDDSEVSRKIFDIIWKEYKRQFNKSDPKG